MGALQLHPAATSVFGGLQADYPDFTHSVINPEGHQPVACDHDLVIAPVRVLFLQIPFAERRAFQFFEDRARRAFVRRGRR